MIIDYLRLMRVQSIPLTVSIICAGFIIESGSLLSELVVPLIVVGAMGHSGFYAMNEILDIEWDKESGKSVKPLVNGNISVESAKALSVILISSSIILAAMLFPFRSFWMYVIASIMGAVYNYRSKKDPFGAVYMGIWGVFILLTGHTYSGGV